jgi:hypothetical protein
LRLCREKRSEWFNFNFTKSCSFIDGNNGNGNGVFAVVVQNTFRYIEKCLRSKVVSCKGEYSIKSKQSYGSISAKVFTIFSKLPTVYKKECPISLRLALCETNAKWDIVILGNIEIKGSAVPRYALSLREIWYRYSFPSVIRIVWKVPSHALTIQTTFVQSSSNSISNILTAKISY